MNPIVDKREEGLRALARMIAAAYRRRMTGETGTTLTGKGDEVYPYLRTRQNTEPEDLRHEGEYFEIIGVDSFIRNKRPPGNTNNKNNKNKFRRRSKCHQ